MIITAIVLALIIFSFLLIKSADMVIISLRRLSRQWNAGVFGVSAIILAIGTSFPELFVGLTSALEKSSNLSLGVVLGSNIANIAFVGALAGAISGKVIVRGNYLRRDVAVALVAGSLPLFLVIDGELGRVDGLILIMVYLAYATSFFRKRYRQIAHEMEEEYSLIYRLLHEVIKINGVRTREMGRLFGGLALLLFSADVIVRTSSFLAQLLNIPLFLVGLIIIAIGTSLPELAFSIRSMADHEPSMFFGNLLGSIIANSTLVIGIASTIHPIQVVASENYLFSALSFIIIFVTFWIFIRTKHRLERWESIILFVLYFLFLALQFH